MNYVQYPGHLGEDGVSAPNDQGWWGGEDPYTNNFFRRCLWPCRYIDCNNNFTEVLCYHACECKANFNRTKLSQVTPAPEKERME